MTDELERHRAIIRECDREITRALHRRAEAARAIGHHKQAAGEPFYDASRQKEVLRQVVEAAAGGAFPADGLRRVFSEIMSVCLGMERPIRVGYLGPPGQSGVWRGPLIHKAVQQFIQDVAWGDLDYLLIDLPPGTGDAQLSLSQTIPLTGVVMVTTPQEISLIDVRKGADMFAKVAVPLIGVVENMSYFVCPGCGEETEIFFRGGGQKIAKELDVPFLGEIPIDTAIRESGDGGIPVVVGKKDSASARAFVSVARLLAGRVSQLNLGGGVSFRQGLPTIK